MMLDASSRRSFEPTKFCLDLMAQNFRLKCPKGVLKATKKGFNSAKSLFIPVRKMRLREVVTGPEPHSWVVVKIGDLFSYPHTSCLLVLLRVVKEMVAPALPMAQEKGHLHLVLDGENYTIVLTVHMSWGTYAFW